MGMSLNTQLHVTAILTRRLFDTIPFSSFLVVKKYLISSSDVLSGLASMEDTPPITTGAAL